MRPYRPAATWALLAAVVAWVSRHPLSYVFAIAWPVAMFFSVVMTGNHFILDAVAGAVVSFAGLGVALAKIIRVVDPEVKNPQSQHWERAMRNFDELM